MMIIDSKFTVILYHEVFGEFRVNVSPRFARNDNLIKEVVKYFSELPGIEYVNFEYSKTPRFLKAEEK